jgi:hypothetical protein
MRKGFLIYEEIRKYFPIYEEAVRHIMTLQLLNSEFPYIGGKFDFLFFISVTNKNRMQGRGSETLILYFSPRKRGETTKWYDEYAVQRTTSGNPATNQADLD